MALLRFSCHDELPDYIASQTLSHGFHFTNHPGVDCSIPHIIHRQGACKGQLNMLHGMRGAGRYVKSSSLFHCHSHQYGDIPLLQPCAHASIRHWLVITNLPALKASSSSLTTPSTSAHRQTCHYQPQTPEPANQSHLKGRDSKPHTHE